jgi:aldose 1-epimerase
MIDEFGTTADGQSVQGITLGAHGLTACILTYGAILQDLRLDGLGDSLTPGSDKLSDYEGKMQYHGAMIGPVANRISGAKARIGTQDCVFEANQGDNITLHSGAAGLHRKHWSIAESSASHVVLTVSLADGDGGFPGNRLITARYDLLPNAALRLTLNATTDNLTPMNLAIHNYWNLDGSDRWAGHRLRLAADHYLPIDEDVLPTGEIAPVEGTGFDFRAEKDLTSEIPPLDTNFCLSDGRMALRDVLWLRGQSGVQMTLATTEPGLQIYDDRPSHSALAIEPQFWPDALAQPGFPDILLAPGAEWQQINEWRFATT